MIKLLPYLWYVLPTTFFLGLLAFCFAPEAKRLFVRIVLELVAELSCYVFGAGFALLCANALQNFADGARDDAFLAAVTGYIAYKAVKIGLWLGRY